MESLVLTKQEQIVDNTEEQALELVADQRLLVSTNFDGNALKILDPEGRVTLAIQVTADGPQIRLKGTDFAIEATGSITIDGEYVSVRGQKGLVLDTRGDLDIRADGDLAIDAQSVAINGRDGFAQTSGGDIQIQADGTLRSEAGIQDITADQGNVNIKANDDVKCNGEHILLNC